jgi:ribosomal RNA assembly protein
VIEMMKYIRIPKERIGVLIGKEGEIKRKIEEMTQTTLEIDSVEGEVVIEDKQTTDPLFILKVEDLIRAIARGFSPEHALTLLRDEREFFLFDIHDYVGKKESHIHRIKSRVIGTHGKTKRTLERLTGANLSIYGHTIAIIADFESMDIVKKAIDMFLTGSKHASVYRYIEREMKKLRIGL